MKRKSNGAETGFTLIEVMVATLLLLIVVAGFLPVFLQGLSQSSAARFKSMATNIAREKMEKIRQLDYREIQELTDDPTNPRNLSVLFGSTVDVPERNMTFSIVYDVVDDAMSGQAIKSVQVTVTWIAPPRPSPAVLKTLVAQQYLGPRGARLVVYDTSPDILAPANTSPPPGTPFPLLHTDPFEPTHLHTTVRYYIAEADWFMAYSSLALALPPPEDVSMISVFRDDAGGEVGRINVSNSGLDSDSDGTKVTDLWFEYSIDANTIPDGYWDLLVTMFNKYDEPGNTWALRVRVEKGPPNAPTNFTAIATSDTTVQLSWLPGTERDRARYVLERMDLDATGTPTWTPVTVSPAYANLPPNTLPPNTATYTDRGALGVLPILDTPPWGRPLPTLPNHYRYRVYGIDTGERSAPESAALSADVTLPPSSPTPKVVVPLVTALLVDAAKIALDSLGLGWTVTNAPVATPAPGTVLAQSPGAGTEVDAGSNVLLTVATSITSAPTNYKVTLAALSKRNISIRNWDNVQVYPPPPTSYVQIAKGAIVELQLPNGTYTIFNWSPSVELISFTVSGNELPFDIPK